MAKKQLVLAFFEYKGLAEKAADELKQWDKASEEIKLGVINILARDDQGYIRTHKLGHRRTTAGIVLGALAAALSGGITVAAGAVFGGALGALFKKGLGIPKDEMDRIEGELNGGKAMLGVLVDPDEAAAVAAKLAELGGAPASYEVSEEALEQAEAAVENTPDETLPD